MKIRHKEKSETIYNIKGNKGRNKIKNQKNRKKVKKGVDKGEKKWYIKKAVAKNGRRSQGVRAWETPSKRKRQGITKKF